MGNASTEPTPLEYADPQTLDPPVNRAAVVSLFAGTSACLFWGASSGRWNDGFLLCLAIPCTLVACFFGVVGCLACVKPVSAGRPRWTWLGILGIFLGVVPVGATLLTPFFTSHQPRYRSICAQNLRHLGQAALLYADENGGHCPDDVAGFLTQDIVTGVFVCPTTNDTPAAEGPTTRATAANVEAGGHLSYVYLGKDWMADELTPTVVLAYEPLTNHQNKGMNVLFGDGHVEFLATAEATTLLAELSGGHNPPRADKLK